MSRRERASVPGRRPATDDGGSDLRSPDGSATAQRIDKWLWFARLVKTRSLAARLVTEGKVRVNRQRIDKPSVTVRPGDVVTATVNHRQRVLKVLSPGERRGSPADAKVIAEDLTPAPEPSGQPSAATVARDPGRGRPTKRDRRAIDRLKGQ